eukprot:PhF_6_TR10098/c0_g1_i2/m.15714
MFSPHPQSVTTHTMHRSATCPTELMDMGMGGDSMQGGAVVGVGNVSEWSSRRPSMNTNGLVTSPTPQNSNNNAELDRHNRICDDLEREIQGLEQELQYLDSEIAKEKAKRGML